MLLNLENLTQFEFCIIILDSVLVYIAQYALYSLSGRTVECPSVSNSLRRLDRNLTRRIMSRVPTSQTYIYVYNTNNFLRDLEFQKNAAGSRYYETPGFVVRNMIKI